MRLHEYQQGLTPRQRPSGRFGIKTRIAGATVAAVSLIGVGLGLSLKGRSVAVPTDPVTLCPTKRPPAEIAVILLDVSDRFSEPQRLQLHNHLARFRDSIPRFGLVEVYPVDQAGRPVSKPLVHLCNPGTGTDLNRIYQNPQLAKKRWDGFAAKLTADIDRQIESPAMSSSPIFEAIQATALRTFGKPEYDNVPKRLVIVSDLLQNVPGKLSMYAGIPSFESFKTSSYFSRVRADLQYVTVSLFYLARPRVASQNQDHLAFWNDYFQFQGAEVESVDKIFGDR